jgi:hypothetical protein
LHFEQTAAGGHPEAFLELIERIDGGLLTSLHPSSELRAFAMPTGVAFEIVEDTNVLSPICPKWHPRQYGYHVRRRKSLMRASVVALAKGVHSLTRLQFGHG